MKRKKIIIDSCQNCPHRIFDYNSEDIDMTATEFWGEDGCFFDESKPFLLPPGLVGIPEECPLEDE